MTTLTSEAGGLAAAHSVAAAITVEHLDIVRGAETVHNDISVVAPLHSVSYGLGLATQHVHRAFSVKALQKARRDARSSARMSASSHAAPPRHSSSVRRPCIDVPPEPPLSS